MCSASLQSSIDHAVDTLDLVLLRQDRDIVLERVWHPELLAAHIRNTLVSIPIFGLGQCFVDAVVEVLVVGEDNMATNVVKLRGNGLDSSRRNWRLADSRSLQE